MYSTKNSQFLRYDVILINEHLFYSLILNDILFIKIYTRLHCMQAYLSQIIAYFTIFLNIDL